MISVFFSEVKHRNFHLICGFYISLQGPVRFYDNERKASILLKQFQSMLYCNMCACISVCISVVSV
jgi:hypothetical protein